MPSAGATARVRMPCRSRSWAARACARRVGSGSRPGSSDHRPPLAAPLSPRALDRVPGSAASWTAARRPSRGRRGRPRGAAARVLCAVLPLPSHARSGREPVVGHVPGPDEVPHGRGHVRLARGGVVRAQLADPVGERRRGTTRRRRRAPRGGRRAAACPGRVRGAQREVRDGGGVHRDQAVVPGERTVARPDHLARGGELVEHRRAVVGDAGGQDVGLERRCRHDGPGQLLDDARDAVHPAQGAGRRAPLRPARPAARPATGAGTPRAPAGRPARPRPAARRATGGAASAARRRRRTRRRCRPSTSGRNRPCTSTPRPSSRRRVSVTTATPQPNRAAA